MRKSRSPLLPWAVGLSLPEGFMPVMVSSDPSSAKARCHLVSWTTLDLVEMGARDGELQRWSLVARARLDGRRAIDDG